MAASDIPSDKEYKDLTGKLFAFGTVSLTLEMAQDTGMAQMLYEASEPLSSKDIATHLKLKERYTREILSSLAALRVIQVEDGTGGEDGEPPRFFVPDSHRHAFVFTSIFFSCSSSAVKRFQAIKSCVYEDGPNGIRYDDEVFRSMRKVSDFIADDAVKMILDTPGLKEQFEKGIEGAEIGCGGGKLTLSLAAMFPNSKFVLTDVVPEPLQYAKENAEKLKLTNVSFEMIDVMKTPERWNERFDWMLSIDVIHDLPHPLKALQEIRKALKPGGQFSMIDMFMSSYLAGNIGNPTAAALYSLSTFFCIPESFQNPDSKALGACWGKERAHDLVQKSGMHVLGMKNLFPDSPGMMSLCMCQKPSGEQQHKC